MPSVNFPVTSRVASLVSLRYRDHATPVRQVDALQERGDHLAELDEHEVRVLAHLGERVRAHPDQHLLVGLPGGEHAEVRTGPRR